MEEGEGDEVNMEDKVEDDKEEDWVDAEEEDREDDDEFEKL